MVWFWDLSLPPLLKYILALDIVLSSHRNVIWSKKGTRLYSKPAQGENGWRDYPVRIIHSYKLLTYRKELTILWEWIQKADGLTEFLLSHSNST